MSNFDILKQSSDLVSLAKRRYDAVLNDNMELAGQINDEMIAILYEQRQVFQSNSLNPIVEDEN